MQSLRAYATLLRSAACNSRSGPSDLRQKASTQAKKRENFRADSRGVGMIKYFGRSSRFRVPVALWALSSMAVLASGCNDYPVHSLLDSFEVRVTRSLARDQAVKVDFLWMIDHSSSMCQEQRALANGFSSFIEKLQNYGRTSPDDPPFIDAQMAIVTVQQVPDTTEIKKIGEFVHKPATVLPPSCIERTKQPCLEDKDCGTPKCFKMYNYDGNSSMCPAEGDTCITPPAMTSGQYWCKADNPQFGNNDNCSVNTQCQLRCNTDSDCYAAFEPNIPPTGKHRVYCNKSVAVPGCMFPPETEGCPTAETLPGVLKQSSPIKCTKANAATACGGGQCVYAKATDKEGSCYDAAGKVKKTQLDYFRCAASVGANQQKEASFEGGLRSMWTALDPNGINCPKGTNGLPTAACQYKQLVRPDAYLVLVAVSDDDDCSYTFELDPYVGDGTSAAAKATLKQVLPDEIRTYCQQYGDRAAGNRDLVNGYCEYMKYKDKQAGKAPRKCISDCADLDPKSGEYTACKTEAEANLAQLLKDNPQEFLQNWRFASVPDFVNRFRSLKSDPARVIFASITGDTLASTADGGKQAETDRGSYYRSLLRNQAPGQAPYICAGGRGEAGYGSRYIQVANAFGDNGLVSNICKGSDFSDALGSIADTILSRVVKVCLPHPPHIDPKTGTPLLKVTRQRGTVKEDMQYVADPKLPTANEKSFYIKATADCLVGKSDLAAQQGQTCKKTIDCPAGLACQDGLCKMYGEAIYFVVTPQQNDKINVNYAADFAL